MDCLTTVRVVTELSAFVDEIQPSANYMYAVRISGRFRSVNTRTVV